MKKIQLDAKSPLKSKIESWALALGILASITGIIGYNFKNVLDFMKLDTTKAKEPLELISNKPPSLEMTISKKSEKKTKTAHSPIYNHEESSSKKVEFSKNDIEKIGIIVTGDHAIINANQTF